MQSIPNDMANRVIPTIRPPNVVSSYKYFIHCHNEDSFLIK